MQCVCCLMQSENKKEFNVLTAGDKKQYQELTRLELFKKKLKICLSCKNSLKSSFEFLQKCIKSHQELDKIDDYEASPQPKRSRRIVKKTPVPAPLEEDTISHLDCSRDDNQDSDENDDLPIATLQQQIYNDKEQESHLTVDEKSTVEEAVEVNTPTTPEIKKKFLCTDCGTSFVTSQRLQIHSFTHSGIKNWKCEECEKVFATKFRLKAHSRTHTGERPFICEICNLSFAQGNALKCHKRTHTKERPFVCKFCSKGFSQNTTLKTHMAALHLGKKIICDEPGCNKRFTRRSYLLIHKRDHLGERKYACDRCPNQYKQKSHLDRHIEASHLGIRHTCDFPGCTSEFSKSWSLKMHKFVHLEETSQLPYQCSICNMGFQRRDKWLKHISKSHPDQAADVKESIEIQEPAIEKDKTSYMVLTSTPEIYTIQNPDGSFTQVQTLQVVES